MKRRITRVLSLGMAAFLVTGALYMPVFASEEGQEEVAVTVVDEAASSEEENISEDQYVEESQTAEENVQEEVQENEGQEETIPAYSDGDAVEEVEGETSDQDTQVSSETNDNTVEVVEENTEEQTAQLSEEVNDSAESAVDETDAEAVDNSGQKSSDADTSAVSVPVLPASESVPAEVTIVEPGTTEEISGVDPAKAKKKGWYKEGSCWYYADSNGKDVTGWKKIDGKWYYFTPSMLSGGEIEINRKSYFFRDDGSLFTGTGWYKDSYGDWYYLSNGKRVEGWKKISGKWYYFYPSMATGEDTIDGSSYRFRDSGSMITGWYKYVWGDGDTDWYYYLPSGRRASGWQKINGKWYYFDKYGEMESDGIEIINGKGYKFSESGAMMYANTTGWVRISDRNGNDDYWYYVSKGGALAVGWKKISGKWYYFDTESCRMYQDWWGVNINGKGYCFSESGAMKGENGGWIEGPYDWYYANKGGSLVTGWKKINGKWYYFDAKDGYEMYYSGTYKINQKDYTFDENGVWTGQ